MITAVKRRGWALFPVSNGLQGDKDIVLEVVQGSGQAFELASLELWVDCDVVLETATHNSP